MMISSIHLDKRAPPIAGAGAAAVTASSRVAVRRQFAPLASLDCSITEPITDSHTSTTETPTLSNYYDCDQLSDMVDDSLFEITNAGCLSKSVFNGRLMMMASPIGEEVGSVNRMDIQENNDNHPVDGDGDGDQDSGTLTPTNDEPNELQAAACVPRREITSSTSAIKQPSQVAMVAEHQAYDYSSTSTIPAQSTRWNQGNGHRQRSRSARFPSNGSSKVDRDAKVAHKSRRKVRSNPDVRDQEGARPEVGQQDELGFCSECRQLAQHDFSGNKKKEKKRFTFNLFNFFSSQGQTPNDNQQSHDDKKVKNDEICTHRHPHPHHQQSQQITAVNGSDKAHIVAPSNVAGHPGPRASISTNRRRSSGTRATDTNGTDGTKIKSRDSIRLMNQKRQRDIRLSQTFTDFQNRDQANELLLDLSQKPPSSGQTLRGGLELRPSQSSYSVMRNNRAVEQNNNDYNNRPQQPRQTKSVKFTMHDKVMIMPSGPGSRAPGSSNPPPAHLQPSAPIIKRSVPKSSSFSQTESNRSLEDLLAKYEVNNELITELNERLKLTETIASPISALDQLMVNQDNHQVGNSRNFSNNYNNQTLYALNPANDRMIRVDNVNTCCDPDRPVPTPSLSSEPENAGFSRDWLEKQHTCKGLI